MEGLICLALVAFAVFISLFFHFLNTGRKKFKAQNTDTKKEYAPLYVSIADKPDAIIRGINKFIADASRTEKAGDRWSWIPMFIFLGGTGMIFIDIGLFVFGYQSFIFSIGGLLMWVAAVILSRKIRKSDSLEFSPRLSGVKKLLHTLRDDLKPGSTFLGHLDLTGPMLKEKVARESKDSRDRTTQLFSDQWLSLKAKLYDGNILRVAATQKSKQRQPYWKRGMSGKMKMKPAKFKGADQELKVRIVVNPQAYDIQPSPTFRQGQNIGKYTITALDTNDGMINILAKSPFADVEHEHILNFLKSAYSLLQRKAA